MSPAKTLKVNTIDMVHKFMSFILKIQTYRKVKDGSVIFYNLENYVVNDSSDHSCAISKVSASNHPQGYQFNQTEDPFYLLGSLDTPADSDSLFTSETGDLDSKNLMEIYEKAYEKNPGHRKH